MVWLARNYSSACEAANHLGRPGLVSAIALIATARTLVSAVW